MNPNNTPPGQQLPPQPPTPPAPAPDEQITEIENPPVAPQGAPPMHQRFSKKMLTALLISVAIFIALYTGIYFFLGEKLNAIMGIKPTPALLPQPTKNPDPLANWQTYTNNELGFTLRFPDGWKVTDESDTANGPRQIRFTPTNAPIPTDSGTRPYGYEFIVWAEKDISLTPEAYWEEKIITGMRTPTSESVTIDGALGILTSNNALDAHDTTIYVSKNNTLYALQENYYLSDGTQARAQFPKAEKEFQQILSTFTFINPDQSDLSKWNDYTNKYFAIKYPTIYTVEEKPGIISSNYPQILSQVVLTSESAPQVWITVANNIQNLSLKDAIGAGPENSYTINDTEKAGVKAITLGGSPAVRYDAADGQAGEHPDVITIKNGLIYQITTKTNDNSYFDQMLSTFRFAY